MRPLLRRSMRVVITVMIGIVFGAALGILARGWMRLVSEDPEFSLSGTLFIVGVFTIWGLAQGFVVGMRRVTSRRWLVSMIRAFGVLGMLPLFLGAGAVMAPTVIFGGLGIHRSEWKLPIRLLLGLIALLPITVVIGQIHSDLSWSWRFWLGIVGLISIWGSLAIASRETFSQQTDGWRVPRLTRVLLIAGVALAVALPAIGVGIR